MPVLCFEADEVTLAGQHTLCLAGTWAFGKEKRIITVIAVIKDRDFKGCRMAHTAQCTQCALPLFKGPKRFPGMSPGSWRCPWPNPRASPQGPRSQQCGRDGGEGQGPSQHRAAPSVPSPPPTPPLCLCSAFLQL